MRLANPVSHRERKGRKPHVHGRELRRGHASPAFPQLRSAGKGLFDASVPVSAVDRLFSVLVVSPHSRGVWHVLVDARLGGHDRELRVALLHKIQVGPIEAAVVTGVKNVFAEVLGVLRDMLQVGIGRIPCKEAHATSQLRVDHKAGIVQFTPIGRGDGPVRPEDSELQAVRAASRLLTSFWRYGLSVFRAVPSKVVNVRVKLVPFLNGNTLVSPPSFVRAVDKPVDSVAVPSQEVQPRIVVGVLVRDEDPAKPLGCRQQVPVVRDVVAIDEERGTACSRDNAAIRIQPSSDEVCPFSVSESSYVRAVSGAGQEIDDRPTNQNSGANGPAANGPANGSKRP